MPYVEDGPDGPQWITKAGVNMGLVGGIGSVGGKFVPGQNYRVDKMAETGLYEDGKKGVRRPGDPDQRIKDMDPMWHPVWDPLWKAVNDVQLPLHFHTFPTTSPKARETAPGQAQQAARFTGVAGFQMNLINIIAAIIGPACSSAIRICASVSAKAG